MDGIGIFEGTEPGGVLAPELVGPPRRALVMAGGGLKVAFQAGVLQVWLDEARDGGAPLEFRHADGASGGVYNLAMWCQGMSGRRIADNWRRFSPVRHGLGLNWRGWPRAESLFSMSTFRRRTMRRLWGLDWERIQSSGRSAGFNIFDVHEQRLLTLCPAAMTEDHLVAATSLPGWYPPVRIRGREHIDAVFVTDANLDAAIESGADELWVVWTVSTRGAWRNGLINHYFQVIEACANGRLRRDLDRIARSNRAHADGRAAEFPHPVRVMALEREVPLHYLFTFRRATIAAAVDSGVEVARAWCRDRGFGIVGFDAVPGATPAPARPSKPVRFRERMVGPVAWGGSSGRDNADVGEVREDAMALRLTVSVDDLPTFLGDRGHVAQLSGSVDCPLLGGTRPVLDGTLALLPETDPVLSTRMEYRLRTTDSTGRALRLVGIKTVRDDPGPDIWTDTTTLDLHAYPEDEPDPVLGGTLRITAPAALRLLTSLRGKGAMGFALFFLRRLIGLYLPGSTQTSPPAIRPVEGWPESDGVEGAHVFAHNERVLPVAPRRAWEVLVAARGWSTFYRNAMFVRCTDDVLRAGSQFRMVTFGLPVTCTVTVFDESRGLLGWRWRGPGARGYHLWSLQPHAEGTLAVTQESQFGFLPWLTRPLLRRVMRIGHDAWLRGLAGAALAPGPPPEGTRVSSDPLESAAS